ncbi:hypothetical protein LOK49_LG11G00124 [Camellia lanceoleosa]|uniref:Uncharacterized protein n=1 Tax=Camellia lanceoleosa TaxID=1840588 RepID=A0ACC0G4Y1_9ERIC|nr:hypothetical protein LOK49_LG11G00124 [Camellia lanceoleosa]
MKSAGNELVSTIGSSVELGIASQIQMPLNHHFYGVCTFLLLAFLLPIITRFAWLCNNEFSRQALAGVNPVNIELLREFPILSKLDPAVYGPPESAIMKDLIEQEKCKEATVTHPFPLKVSDDGDARSSDQQASGFVPCCISSSSLR